MNRISNEIESILTKQQLEKDYKDLKSLFKIAQKYDVSTVPIKARFIKYGIPFISKNHINDCNHNIFNEESESAFYLAGFIAADGCIRIARTNKNSTHINHRVVIGLSEKDIDFLYTLRNAFDCESQIGCYDHKLSLSNENWKDIKLVKLSITSKQMVENLGRFNIGPRKSLVYDLPEWIITHPLLNHFIRGYVDGDGSFWIGSGPDKNNITFSLRGTVPFLEKIKMIFERYCDIKTRSKPKMSGGIGQFSIHSNKMVSKISDYLYNNSTIFLPRKHFIAIKAGQIIKVQEDAKNKIQNILGKI
jgi:intein/homing endonuclease